VTPERTNAQRLSDMVEYAEYAVEFAEGHSFDSFQHDKRTVFAVVRAVEVIGEAASRLPISFRDSSPDVPWADIIGMRNKLIHNYIDVNISIVWSTVQKDIPPVLPVLVRLRDLVLAEEKTEPA